MDLITPLVIADERARIERLRKAQAAYAGNYPKVIKAGGKDKPDDNVLPNLAKFIVDKSASFLFGAGLTFDVNDDSESEADQFLQHTIKRNRGAAWFKRLAISGGINGQVFVKIMPPDTARGELYPRWAIQDPETVTVTWDPEDFESVRRYKIEFNTTDEADKPIVRKQIIEPDVSRTKWTITDYKAKVTTLLGARMQEQWELISITDWPFPWAPIVTCQNMATADTFWGASDLEPDILHMINRIQYVLSNATRLNRIHGHPKQVGSGFRAAELNVGSDEMTLLPPGAKIDLLEAHGDMEGALKLYQALNDILFMVSRIPQVSMGKIEQLGAIAGVTLKILYAPLMELTKDKRGTYEPLLIELAERTLELGGKAGEVTIEWKDPQPVNDVELRDNSIKDLDMGIVSQETIAEKLGYDWEKEKERIDAETEDAMATQQARMAAGLVPPTIDPMNNGNDSPDGQASPPSNSNSKTASNKKVNNNG